MSGLAPSGPGCPTTTPSTSTEIVDPSIGTIFGCCVSAQPKLTYRARRDLGPRGVSIDPNGVVAAALFDANDREPTHARLPSRSLASA